MELLHAEGLGLQDVLTDAGAEAAALAAQLAETERHLAEADACIDRACAPPHTGACMESHCKPSGDIDRAWSPSHRRMHGLALQADW